MGDTITDEQALFDRIYHMILTRMVETGRAPHYTEIAAELGMSMEAGRQALHNLLSSGMAAWLHPDTDLIASFAPFNNLPTQYRITIDNRQKWFGQ